MKIEYTGDINIEYGGTFYNLDNVKYGYFDALQITPCSDAGLSDNCFWVGWLTVNIPDKPERIKSIADCIDSTPEKMATNPHEMFYGCLSYGCYEQERSEILQLGHRLSEFGQPAPSERHVIKANWKLENYARKLAKQYLQAGSTQWL